MIQYLIIPSKLYIVYIMMIFFVLVIQHIYLILLLRISYCVFMDSEFPLDWMTRHLEKSGFRIEHSKSFSILHTEDSILRQVWLNAILQRLYIEIYLDLALYCRPIKTVLHLDYALCCTFSMLSSLFYPYALFIITFCIFACLHRR